MNNTDYDIVLAQHKYNGLLRQVQDAIKYINNIKKQCNIYENQNPNQEWIFTERCCNMLLQILQYDDGKVKLNMYFRINYEILQITDVIYNGYMSRVFDEYGNEHFFDEIIGEPSYHKIDLIKTTDLINDNLVVMDVDIDEKGKYAYCIDKHGKVHHIYDEDIDSVKVNNPHRGFRKISEEE